MEGAASAGADTSTCRLRLSWLARLWLSRLSAAPSGSPWPGTACGDSAPSMRGDRFAAGAAVGVVMGAAEEARWAAGGAV